MNAAEDTCFLWGSEFDAQREEQDQHALDHLFPRHYMPPPLAQAAAAAAFPDWERVADACAHCDFAAAAQTLPGLCRTDMEAVAMLTLNDNRPESPFAVVNAALCCAKTPGAPAAALDERDERLCQICDYLWLLLTGLRKLPRVPRSLLYCPCVRTPGRAPPRVGERLVAPGFVYARTQWDVAKRAAEQSRGTLFVLHECWGYAVAPFSFFGHDNDLLLEPGTQFRVDEVAPKERYTVVHLYRRDAPLYLERRMASDRVPIPIVPGLPDPQQQQPDQQEQQLEQLSDSQQQQQQQQTLAGSTGIGAVTMTTGTQTGGNESAGKPGEGDDQVCVLDGSRTLPGSQTMPSIHDVLGGSSSSGLGVGADPLLARSMGARGAGGAGGDDVQRERALTHSAASLAASPAQPPQDQPPQQQQADEGEDLSGSATAGAAGGGGEAATPEGLAALGALCPACRSDAMKILDDNHLFFYPDNVNATPLAAALASARLARADELQQAAATFLETAGSDLFPAGAGAGAGAATRSAAFARSDAEVLVMLTTNDTQPTGMLAAVNSCFTKTHEAKMSCLADLLWYVLAALRKLAVDARHATLYRGMYFSAGTPLPAVGARVVWSEFFYAALDADAAAQTLADLCTDAAARHVVFELRGAPGYDLRPYSFLGHDAVRLVEPGLTFRVAAVDTLSSSPSGGGVVLVRMDHVPGPLLLEHRMARYVPPAVVVSSSSSSSGTGTGSDTTATSGKPRYTFGFAPVASGSSRKDSKEQREADALFSSFALDTAALDLSGKCLSAVPRAVYALPALRTLQLHCNALTAKHLVFPAGAAAPLQGLQELVLSQNQLSTLPECYAGLCNLQTLCLDHNAFRAIPPCIAAMTRLRTLDLCANKVRTVPDWFTQLRDLQVLRIADNQVEALPANIGALTNLHTLNLAGNRLRALPETFGGLVRLQQLRITQNQLQSLPPTFALLTQFRELDLAHNQFDKIPDALSHLPLLARLDLDDNKLKLKALPQWLFLLPALQSLRLTNNPCSAKAKGLLLLSKNPVET